MTILEPLQKAITDLAAPCPTEDGHLSPGKVGRHMYDWFHRQYGHGLRQAPSEIIHNFLAAHSDEDRLLYAEMVVKSILSLTDLEDADWFRQGVLRKENIPETAYIRQRDHSAHTLNNYLLGWYFYRASSKIRGMITTEATRRLIKIPDEIFNFGQLWCFASILHDVGYLFEGEIPAESVALLDRGMRDGAVWAADYFENVFWEEIGLRSVDERQAVRELLGTGHDLNRLDSPGSIAYYLRDLGALADVANAIRSEGHSLSVNPLPSDAFEVWKLHYGSIGNSEMAKRIEGLEEAFYQLIRKGIEPEGTRVLDHGVCGGLVLLKYSTLWFRLYAAVRAYQSDNETWIKKIIGIFESYRGGVYIFSHWWQSVVWATAAVALHNVQQCSGMQGHRGPLRIDEDPLAYLGILVDILQDWDRHSTRRVRAIQSGRRIVSSKDVRIGVSNKEIVVIEYGVRGNANPRDKRKSIEKELGDALHDWSSFVEIRCVSAGA